MSTPLNGEKTKLLLLTPIGPLQPSPLLHFQEGVPVAVSNGGGRLIYMDPARPPEKVKPANPGFHFSIFLANGFLSGLGIRKGAYEIFKSDVPFPIAVLQAFPNAKMIYYDSGNRQMASIEVAGSSFVCGIAPMKGPKRERGYIAARDWDSLDYAWRTFATTMSYVARPDPGAVYFVGRHLLGYPKTSVEKFTKEVVLGVRSPTRYARECQKKGVEPLVDPGPGWKYRVKSIFNWVCCQSQACPASTRAIEKSSLHLKQFPWARKVIPRLDQ